MTSRFMGCMRVAVTCNVKTTYDEVSLSVSNHGTSLMVSLPKALMVAVVCTFKCLRKFYREEDLDQRHRHSTEASRRSNIIRSIVNLLLIVAFSSCRNARHVNSRFLTRKSKAISVRARARWHSSWWKSVCCAGTRQCISTLLLRLTMWLFSTKIWTKLQLVGRSLSAEIIFMALLVLELG